MGILNDVNTNNTVHHDEMRLIEKQHLAQADGYLKEQTPHPLPTRFAKTIREALTRITQAETE